AEVVAVGCTSRAQAQQLGRYLLETAQTETRLISFETGLYGADLMPGELFAVYHPEVAGARLAGRLLSVSGREVVLDAPVVLQAGTSYSLECPMPDGSLVQRGVSNAPGETATLKLVAAFPDTPVAGATWALRATHLQPTLWRCVGQREVEPGRYAIDGLQHNPNKWQAVERGIRIDAPPVSGLPDPSQIPPVASVALRETSYVTGDGRRALRIEVDWPALAHPYLRGYVVGYRRDGGSWQDRPEQVENHLELDDLQPGVWDVRVSSVSATGLRSVPVIGRVEAAGYAGKPGKPSLAAVGGAAQIALSWQYPAGVPDLRRVQLRYSTVAGDRNPTLLAELAYPASHFVDQGLMAGARRYYWLRVQDSWGNWSDDAQADAAAIRDPGVLQDQLQQAIGGSELADEIRQPISAIPGIQQAADQAIEAALQSMLTADELLQVQARQYALAKEEIEIVSNDLEQEVTARLLLAAGLGETQAGLLHEQSVRADGDQALARDIQSLTARTDQTAASLRHELEAQASATGAVARELTLLQSTVGDQSAAVLETAQAVDGIRAEKVIKVTAGGKVAGI
ncbi:hypothetical protein QR66_01825, partial [Chromobacterium piscinae]